MSWLSKALGGNTLKIGLALAAGGFGREYLYGQTSSTMYDTATGQTFRGGYTGQNIFGRALGTLGVKPFQETALGKSAVGSFIDYLGPRDDKGNRIVSSVGLLDTVGGALGTIRNIKQNMPQKQKINTFSGYDVRSDTRFGSGQVQMMPVGRGGQVLTALNNNDQYFARQVRMMNLPRASSLPSPGAGSGVIQTTAMRSRGLKKLGLGKA